NSCEAPKPSADRNSPRTESWVFAPTPNCSRCRAASSTNKPYRRGSAKMFPLIRSAAMRFAVLTLLLMVVCQGAFAAQASAPLSELRLLSRSSSAGMQPTLSAEQWQWVRDRRVLVVGASAPSFAPVEMINADTYYEGVTADVLG